jgi:hypothetical protein
VVTGLRVASVCLVATLLCAHCRDAAAQHGAEVTKRVQAIKRAFACIDTLKVPVRSMGPRMARADCWLVGLALHEVAVGHAKRYGINPSDTLAVTQATLHELRFAGLRGSADRWYWIVTLTIDGRAQTIEVYIDQLSPNVEVKRTEGTSPAEL